MLKQLNLLNNLRARENMEFEKISVYDTNKFLCDLIGIKDIFEYTPEKEVLELLQIEYAENSQIIIFETSNGLDFVKIIAEKTMFGIRAETMCAYYLYPEFEKIMQSLILLKVGNNELPFDLIKYVNENGEEKYIYFEISSFYGKNLA
jgi:hypothetical protein